MTTGLLVLPDDEPLLFAGPADAVRARLHLLNDSDTRVSLRRARVEVTGLPAVEIALVAVLPPGASCRTTAVLNLPRSTPPGSYVGEVELGGQRWPAQVVIVDSSVLSVTPRTLVLAASGTPLTVVARNDGTVSLDLPAVVTADLDEGPVTCRLAAPVHLAPERSAVLTLTITLPAGLDPSRRYTVRLPLGPAELEVVIPPHTPARTRPKAPRRSS